MKKSQNQSHEPEGVKIAPDGRTVFMTLQESNEIGWFDILSPPDTLVYKMEFTSVNHKPDGIWVNDAQTYVATAGEIDENPKYGATK